MSTSADVRAAWKTNIFDNATIQAISPNAISHPYTELSEDELSALYAGQEVNFFEYLVTREIQERIMGGATGALLRFQVEVRYTLEKSTDGSTHNAIEDDLEALIGLVETQLASTWSNTVDFFTYQSGPIQIEPVTIAGAECLRGSYKFYGTQETTL